MFSTVIVTRGRPQILLDAIKSLEKLHCPEIIIVVNDCADTIDALDAVKAQGNIKIMDMPENLGCGPARHEGLLAAKYDKVMMLDDDALVLDGSDVHHCLDRLPDYAIVQGVILADESGARRRHEQPFKWRKNRKGDHEVSYFIGANHFIHRPQFLRAGGYIGTTYWFEELELSLRLLAQGGRLLFTDRFRVHHLQAQAQRQDRVEQAHSMIKTRNRIAVEYFPFAVSMVCQIVWNIKLLPKTRRLSFAKQEVKPRFGYLDFVKTPRLLSRAFA